MQITFLGPLTTRALQPFQIKSSFRSLPVYIFGFAP
jgi:hypothetical protein